MKKFWYLPIFALLVALPACKDCCKRECRPVEKKVVVAQTDNENRSAEKLALQKEKINKEDYTAIQA